MNTGIIASRYADAFLRYVTETGRASQVCSAVEEMLSDPDSLTTRKLEPEIERLVTLLAENNRVDCLKPVLQDFVDSYYKSVRIKLGYLRTVVESPTLEKRLKDIVREATGCELKLKTVVDPALIGGFVFVVDDMMLDASVSRQIELIRRQFVEKTNRIV